MIDIRDVLMYRMRHYHVGERNGIHMRDLAQVLQVADPERSERNIRLNIEQLRRDGHPICATPGGGYYLAANADELNRACEFLYSRAICSLEQVAAMKRVALPDLRGQLRLPT